MENGYISLLDNTVDDQFLYSGEDLDSWFDHSAAKIGDIFYDGNNGDRWCVIATNPSASRMVVENTTQGGLTMMYW